jgi:hypothetical protein
MSDEKRSILPKAFREMDLKTEYLESLAAGAGKATGMGIVIILALVLIKAFGVNMAWLTEGL